jgi:hypothetical protein
MSVLSGQGVALTAQARKPLPSRVWVVEGVTLALTVGAVGAVVEGAPVEVRCTPVRGGSRSAVIVELVGHTARDAAAVDELAPEVAKALGKLTPKRGGGGEQVELLGNPSATVADAERAWTDFHWGDRPDGRREVASSALTLRGPLVELGALVAVTYRTAKAGELADWEHVFGDGAEGEFEAPSLVVDTRGRLGIVGGSYTVEDRGIVG